MSANPPPAPGPNGFPRSRRLLSRDQYDRVFARPRRSADGYLAVLGRPSPTGESRLGLAISKKAVRRAVDRSRIKRVAREVFRQLTLSTAWDFVVLARSGAAGCDTKTLASVLQRHFSRITTAGTSG